VEGKETEVISPPAIPRDPPDPPGRTDTDRLAADTRVEYPRPAAVWDEPAPPIGLVATVGLAATVVLHVLLGIVGIVAAATATSPSSFGVGYPPGFALWVHVTNWLLAVLWVGAGALLLVGWGQGRRWYGLVPFAWLALFVGSTVWLTAHQNPWPAPIPGECWLCL
jgi:hypothetical protein